MWRKGWTSIAELSGSDRDTQSHVEHLLSTNRIPNAIEGSKSYFVFVPSEMNQSAIKLLHADARCGNYSIRIVRSIDSDEYVQYGVGQNHS
jgi:hypothetical protein